MKKVELSQFLENIVKQDPQKPDIERYANSICCAYTNEEISKVIEIYEELPRCDSIKASIANAKTYRVMFLLEKMYGKGSVQTLIEYLKKKVPQEHTKFSDIKLDVN